MTTSTPTSTFSAASWAFLDRLATDNTKATFDAQRDVYEAAVVAPSRALVEALTPLLVERVHPGLRGEARVGRSLFRLNRDLRFSRDKTPYKTHLDFLFWVGDGPPREQPACILRLTSTAVLFGAGRAGLRGPALARYRERLDDPVDGAAVRSIVDDLVAQGAQLSEAARARPPRPFPADHPNAELLRRDGFHLSTTRPHPAALGTGAFPAWLADRLAPTGPLLDWLVDGDR